MHRHAIRAALVAHLVLVPSVLVAVAPGRADAAAPWTRPVPGPVVRTFVAPVGGWGPGHRGLDLRAAPGEPVRAVAAGSVEVAGPVAGALHVVLRHPDTSRTGYSFLATVAVRPGDRVAAGTVVGTAGGAGSGHRPGVVHLSWRRRGVYLDPARRLAPRGYRLVVPGPTGGVAGGLG